MSPDKDKALCENYPEIFMNRHGNPQNTAMCWGFECGDGWYDLIDRLCANIQNYIKNKNNNNKEVVPQVVALQVKEKFGTLRFYVSGGDDFTDGMIWMAESMSGKICEVCGNSGTTGGTGWISTKCEKHKD